MSERVKSQRVKSQRAKSERTLPAELSSPSVSAVSRLPAISGTAKLPERSVGSSAVMGSGDRPSGGFAWNLVGKADALLAESAGAGDAADRFRCGYLAALRGAGAVLAVGVVGTGSRRKRSGNAWALLDSAAPTFGAWSRYFAGWSDTRAAVETGLRVEISDADADAFVVEVGRFLTAVEEYIGQALRIDLRAS